MKVFYASGYYADIGEGHVFPIRKFERAAALLIAEGTLKLDEIIAPQPAALADLYLVHNEDYVTRLRAGALTEREIRRLGLPWSKSLVRRSMLAASGTINAARRAVECGFASNLAGGTHHAFADRGEGFCVFNDVAIATRVLQRDGIVSRVAVVDCDVHQGNGTATIFAGDERVFTFSMHGAKNYPLFKAKSTLDIELPDRTNDADYLSILEENLPRVFAHNPDIVFYLGGADPYMHDKLGRLALTIEGLRARDTLVLHYAKQRGIPIVTTMSGGYATNISDTVEIHCNTIRAVKEEFEKQ
ncbi:MAG: histone deacetylase [Pyrinomonadaceae bacterium MAG19_C2-C3]|nr:histone deacetylase [Pyrinomonadaceae bacterium MAG19_C2-C3]